MNCATILVCQRKTHVKFVNLIRENTDTCVSWVVEGKETCRVVFADDIYTAWFDGSIIDQSESFDDACDFLDAHFRTLLILLT